MSFSRPSARATGWALTALALLAMLLAAYPTYAGARVSRLRPPARARLTAQAVGAGLRVPAAPPEASATAATGAYRLYLPAVANGARAAEAPGGEGDFRYSSFLMPY